jgi:hypothetical protein
MAALRFDCISSKNEFSPTILSRTLAICMGNPDRVPRWPEGRIARKSWPAGEIPKNVDISRFPERRYNWRTRARSAPKQSYREMPERKSDPENVSGMNRKSNPENRFGLIFRNFG